MSRFVHNQRCSVYFHRGGKKPENIQIFIFEMLESKNYEELLKPTDRLSKQLAVD